MRFQGDPGITLPGGPFETLLLETGSFHDENNPVHSQLSSVIDAMMENLNYDVVNIGVGECERSHDQIIKWASSSKLPLIASNIVGLPASVPNSRQYRAGTKKVIVFGVVGLTSKNRLPKQLIIEDPGRAIDRLLSSCYNEGDIVVILSDNLSYNESVSITNDRRVSCVIGAKIPIPPNSYKAFSIFGRDTCTMSIIGVTPNNTTKQVGAKGAELLLESAIKEDTSITRLDNPTIGFPYIRIAGSEKVMYRFVGSLKCSSCHKQIYQKWGTSEHASSLERLKGIRDTDSCVYCHSTGFGYDTGYLASGLTLSELGAVGCESCHGPGSEHVDKISASDDRQHAASNHSLFPQTADASCTDCHDQTSSPGFSRAEYLAKINKYH